jgi:hypothetical protein
MEKMIRFVFELLNCDDIFSFCSIIELILGFLFLLLFAYWTYLFIKNIKKVKGIFQHKPKIIQNYLRYSFRIFSLNRRTASSYIVHFGWIAISIIFILTVLFFWVPEHFHWILLIFILSVFLLSPMKLIYSLVGGSNSLRTFFILFIVTQLLFSLLYLNQLEGYCIVKEEGEITISNCNCPTKKDKTDIALTKINCNHVLLNTFYTALIQENAPLFNKIIENESEDNKLYEKIFVIVNIQIFISWIYLGVLIASLYNKITNR